MRAVVLAAIVAFGVANAAHASDVHDLNLSPSEQTVRSAMVALASTLANKCSNVPWQVSSDMRRRVTLWAKAQGISHERLQFIADTTPRRAISCAEVPDAMSRINAALAH
jgi:hypothetical protein